ncbi:hypothetical protein WN51_12648 [Melipona quadrifasciata]|uniref:CHK kinase-like domain-containing protein n=1 Tax=Melipona quadrifasciata TaxID=166423 RepID=A0A0N0BGS2_9HYME|nr:hypothetical protein WN51_12648 [Melipona quadrifasciata]
MEVNHLTLDERVFEKALRKKLSNETARILEIKYYYLSEKGVNFLSDLYEICIKYMVPSNNEITKETKSEQAANVVVKVEPLNELLHSIVSEQDLFDTELKVLRDVLPRIKEFVSHQLGPDLLYGCDVSRIIIMENLIERGFVMKDRQKGLSLLHSRLVVQQLARLHAGSVAVFEKIDYQMSVYTSPAVDLLHFLNICPEFDLKYTQDNYYLKIYLDTLEETMKNIGCKRKPPTMKQLKEAMHKRRLYAVFCGVILYLRMMADKEDTEDFVLLFDELSGETKLDVFKNPDAVKLAHKMIPIMNERGYFD